MTESGGEEKTTTIKKIYPFKGYFFPTNERRICKNSCQHLVGVAMVGGGGGVGSGGGGGRVHREHGSLGAPKGDER